ncbi:hypothetical protein CPC08DRAFT_707231 [Agrocybe pediades]|nr:hypothetical protein CPC08DRAFT_707231 [Agrocybe pediades]
MSIRGMALLLTVIWCTIYLVRYFTTRHTSAGLLPTNFGQASLRPKTKVTLHNLQLRYSTGRWNTSHDKLSTFLLKKSTRVSAAVKSFYDIGSIFSAFGMAISLAGLLWISFNSGWMLFLAIYGKDASPSLANHLSKRAIDAEGAIPPSVTSTSPEIIPIIPGVTVPLGHLPLIVIAVFLSQLVHELGHAVAGARESLPMISAGFSFIVCIPSAFVAFPVAGLKNLTAKARCRVISAGPFHNLAFWGLILLFARLIPGKLCSLLSGYKNVSNIGKVVVDVNMDSPLSLYLQPGSVVTRLDDVSLSGPMSSVTWTNYLTGDAQPPAMGWCLHRSDLEKAVNCCSPSGDKKASPLSCFVSHEPSIQGCMDPVPVLTKPYGYGRCKNSEECARESVCTFLERSSQLMRITVRNPDMADKEETVVLWSGPRLEVWEEVQVGDWLPRVWFLPLKLPLVADLFWQYLKMATISLFFVNLLPLPHLDGAELLRSFLDVLFSDSEPFTYDMEAMQQGRNNEDARVPRRLKERISTFMSRMTASLAVSTVALSGFNLLLKS